MSQYNGSYSSEGFADITTSRDTFATQFDLERPEKAMSSYQKIMHEHTKQQFEIATASSRRRSSTHDTASLNTERSTGSVSSTSS